MLYIFIWMISGVIFHTIALATDVISEKKVSHNEYFFTLMVSVISGPIMPIFLFLTLKNERHI